LAVRAAQFLKSLPASVVKLFYCLVEANHMGFDYFLMLLAALLYQI
jgi:hypothetical protein